MNAWTVLVMAAVVLVAAGIAPVHGQTDEKTIAVTGSATVFAEPDLLVVKLGVQTQRDTAKDALESNSDTMNGVLDAIMSAGITQDEISTSQLEIYPAYGRYDERIGTSPLVGYKVTNTIMVRTANLSGAADIIDGGVTAGANRIDGVYFTLSPEKQLTVKDDLIADAVLNAKSKAQKALAPLEYNITGVKAVTLSEFAAQPEPVFYADAAEMSALSFKSSTPVLSSDQQVTTRVGVIFLIGAI